MRKFFLFLLSALGVALLFSGCIKHKIAADPEARGPVLIGAVLPLSGQFSVSGERMLSGLQYAEYELNNHRGINNRPVKLLVFDTQSSGDGAEKAFASAARSGVSGIICGYSEDEVRSVLPLAEKYSIPSIIPLVTADSTVNANTFVFRNIYTDRQQGEALAAYLWYWRQMLRISVLMDVAPESGYERNTARAVAAAFKELGGTVTNMPAYRRDDFSKAVNEALVTGPQAVIVSARGERAGKILKELRRKGYKGTICGLDNWDSPEFFSTVTPLSDLGDCVYVSYFTPANSTEEFKDFKENFRRRHFHEPGNVETASYDALKLLAIGLGRAATIEDFRKNWLTIRNHFGAGATYTMLRDGNVDRTMYINALEPGKNGLSSYGRLVRSFMHSKLATYRY